jgi:hypothetical protein
MASPRFEQMDTNHHVLHSEYLQCGGVDTGKSPPLVLGSVTKAIPRSM